jgi:UDP-N-acetylmuramate dehydrogenase
MHRDAPFVVRQHVPLAPLTTLGIGGSARWFATATHPAHVAAAHAWSRQRAVPLLVIGGGSNLVIADRGIEGLVLRIEIGGLTHDVGPEGDTRSLAGAGESWDVAVAATVARGLAGLECLSGIPGTVGGTPIQNVGAYGQEVADAIESVTAFDTENGEFVAIPADDCRFSYRTSRFKSEPGRFIVTQVTFRLRPGDPTIRYPDLLAWMAQAGISRPTLQDARRAVLAVRRTKGMVVDATDADSRSAGSFFMNPIVTAAALEAIAATVTAVPPHFPAGDGEVKIPAAWLIEHAGFAKGHEDGRVGLSTKHPLALINRGRATAQDMLRLATRIKRTVADRFGVLLRPEPIFVGFDNDPDVDYLLDTKFAKASQNH